MPELLALLFIIGILMFRLRERSPLFLWAFVTAGALSVVTAGFFIVYLATD